jgi:hypothetical protein
LCSGGVRFESRRAHLIITSEVLRTFLQSLPDKCLYSALDHDQFHIPLQSFDNPANGHYVVRATGSVVEQTVNRNINVRYR